MKRSRIQFLAATFGNVLEHYDKALFAFLAPFLAPLLFERSESTTALISTYLILPLGLISKPLGALIFGKLGDQKGRKTVLVITLLGMGVTTALIGTIPIPKQHGWIAPTLFAIGLLLQNFFASGEAVAGALLVLESSSREKRGLINAFYESSTLLGFLLASIGVTLLTLKGQIETHWRLLYWIGGSVGGVGLIIRFFVKTPSLSFKKREAPLFSFLWQERASLLIIVLASGFSYANYYLLTSFLNGFLPLVSQISKSQAIQANTSLLWVDFILLFFAGRLSLHFPKEKLLFFFAFIGTMLAMPLYASFSGSTPLIASCIRFVFLVIGVGFSVVLIPFYQEWIPQEKRLTLIAFGNALGSQIFGTSACPLGFWLYKQTGWAGAPGLYLMGIGFAAFSSLYLFQNGLKKRRSAPL